MRRPYIAAAQEYRCSSAKTYCHPVPAIAVDFDARHRHPQPLQNSDEAIAAGLLIAREKFGTNLTLAGSAEFQRRVVAVAVAQGIAVRFVDPQLDAIRQQLADDKYKSPRAPARPLQQSPAPDLAPSNDSAKRAVAVPAVDPHQAATAPVQQTATRKTKRAAAPVAAEARAAVPRQVTSPASAPQQIPAHVWLATWAAEENKIVVRPTPERGNIAHGCLRRSRWLS